MANATAPARPNLPPAHPAITDPAVRDSFSRLTGAMVSELTKRLDPNSPVPSIMLLSPGGKVFAVSVDDTGTLITTLVHG